MRIVSTWVGKALPLAGGTMTGNIAMGDNKVTGQGKPTTQNDGLRYAQAEIRNAEIYSNALIAITKLELALALSDKHIAAAAEIAESKIDLAQGTQALWDKIITDIASHSALRTGIHGVIIAVKPDDQIVNNSTALQNDDDLVLSVGANDIWIIHMVFIFEEAISGTDIDYAFTVPTDGRVRALSKTAAAETGDRIDLTAENTIQSAAAGDIHYKGLSVLYIGGGTAGNLQLQWAQTVAKAGNLTLYEGSFMRCCRIV